MKKHNSAVSICQPSCGYYFSSGYFISENCSAGYYASDGSSTLYSHGALYNAVSRIVVDGGRKAIAYMAMAGMLTQNLELAAYAEVPEAAVYHISRYIPPETEYTGTNTDGTQYTINGSKIIGYSIDRGWLNISAGGSALNTIVNNGFLNLSNGAIIYDTQLNNGKVRVYDGGTAATTTINGGTQAIYSGGIALNAIINAGGSQLIYSSGIASDTIINAGGFQQVYSGGSAIGFTVAEGGTQVLDEGAVAVSAIIIGDQYVFSGATTENIAVKTGAQHILSSGSAISTLLSEDGQQIVSEGGYAGNTTINAYGIQTVLENGVAQNANVEFGGKQIINSGSADGTTVKSGGVLSVIAGEATDIAQNIGGAIIAAVSGDDGIKINGIYNDDTAINFSQENGIANNFVIENGGVQNVGAGGTANSTTVNSAGIQTVLNGGTANYAVVNATGTMNVSRGGTAISAVINELGVQNVSGGGYASGTVVSGGAEAYPVIRAMQNIYDGGSADSTVLYRNGSQVVSSGGIARDTVINDMGALYVRGGSAYDIRQSAGGYLAVSVGGNNSSYAQGAYYAGDGSSRAFLLSGGVASGFTINTGILKISNGGVASDTILNSNASQVISKDGNAVGTIIYNAQEIVLSGGSTNGTIVNKPNTATNGQYVINGGTATATMVNSGGYQRLGSENSLSTFLGGTAENTVLSGGTQIVLNSGTANYTSIYESGIQEISSGGIANFASVNFGASQIVNISGTANYAEVRGSGLKSAVQEVHGNALSTVVYGRGKQNVSTDGTADYTSVMADGTQNVYGTANNTYINYGGTQNVQTGGTVYDTVLSGSGTRNAQQDVNGTAYDTQITTGTQNINYGGSAVRTSLFAGGSQGVGYNGTAETTYINQGGVQTVYDAGIATGTVINEGGIQNVSGTADYTSVNAGGTQNVSGTANNTYINYGGTQNVQTGGTVYDTVLSGSENRKAQQDVNGTAYDTQITSGTQNINGGSAVRTSLFAGGSQGVGYNGTAETTYINQGGVQTVYDAGIATGTVINEGGTQNVSGTAYYTVIKATGTQTVSNGGKAYFTIVSNGGSQVVEAGGSAMHNILFDVNNQTAATGATFINHVVSAENSSVISSTHTITNGKAEYNIFIATHGYQHISSGGLALATTLNGGGFDGVARQYVYSGGIALSTTVNDLGFVRVSSGGSAISTVISAEGEASAFMTVLASGYASGIVVQGGTNANLIVGENDEDKPLYWTAAGGTVYDVTVENGGRAVVYGTNALHGRTVLNFGGTIAHGWLNSGESTGTAGTLTVENLVADGGIVRLPVKLDAGSAAAVGHIKITESHSGTAYIDLNRLDDGTATASITDNSFMLVEYSTGVVIAEGATFDLVGGAYTAGAYEYTLNKSTDSADRNYYLRTDGKLTQGANNAGSTPGMAGAAAGAALNSLQKRLGDLRGMGSTAARHGIWGRSYYKNMTLKAYEDVKMDVSGIEAGYDFKLSGYDYSGDNYRNNGLYLGLMAANIDISADGKGSGEGLLGGGYATYLAENGWFADFTLRSGRTEIEVYTFPNAGGKIVISPERAFIAASMETGYTADLRNGGKGWKVEPKAELQYMRMGSKDTETNTHIPVQYGGAEYYTGIGTIYASYTSMRQNGMMTEPFAEITYKYEFDGKEKVQYQTANMTSDTGGGTVEGRIGVNMQLTSGLYWHAAASYEDGHSVKSYGADAGIRYSFGGK